MNKAWMILTTLLVLTGCGASPAATPMARASSGLAARNAGATLSMLSYNTWGKPGLLGTDEKRRMRLIGPAIRPWEVVALQETFTAHSKTMGQLSGFPHQLWQDNGGLLKLNCGLYTLSRHPIVERDFAAFKQAATWDRHARKGVSFTRLDVPGVGMVDVYNTHYQAEDPYTEIRKHDNSVLAGLVAKHDQGQPTFLMGDFNMAPGTPEYQDLMQRLSPRDAFAEKHPGAPGFTSDPSNPHKAKKERGERIDYLFILPNRRFDIAIEDVEVAMKDPVEGVVLSDHYGVSGQFRLTPKAK